MTDDQASAIFSLFQTDSIIGKALVPSSADIDLGRSDDERIKKTCNICSLLVLRSAEGVGSLSVTKFETSRRQKNEKRKWNCRLRDFRLVIEWPHFDANEIVSLSFDRDGPHFSSSINVHAYATPRWKCRIKSVRAIQRNKSNESLESLELNWMRTEFTKWFRQNYASFEVPSRNMANLHISLTPLDGWMFTAQVCEYPLCSHHKHRWVWSVATNWMHFKFRQFFFDEQGEIGDNTDDTIPCYWIT